MKTSIYISSEKLEVIGYTKRGKGVYVRSYADYPLPEGTVINGKITDPSSLIECIAALKRKKRGAFSSPGLIVDGSTIMSKTIAAPKLNKRRYYRLVEDEFADNAGDSDEMIYGFSVLRKAGGRFSAILACAADKSLVRDFESAFGQAGVKLRAIKIGVQAVLNFVETQPELQESTFVINIIDGVTMLSMIFENGVNVFVSRTRLYGESTEQILQNILDSLSGLIQFNSSQKFSAIKCSYYHGLGDDDLRRLKALNPHADTTLEKLRITYKCKKKASLPQEAHFVLLNALLGNRGIDLIKSRKMQKKVQKSRRPKKLWIPALAVVTALLCAPIVYMHVMERGIDKESAEHRAYLSDSAAADRAAELDEISGMLGYYNNALNHLREKDEYEQSLAKISNELLDLITGTMRGKVRVNSFDFDEITGIIRAEATSAGETDSAEYIDALKRSSLVDDVKYRGYSYNEKGEYSFSFDVSLALGEAAQ